MLIFIGLLILAVLLFGSSAVIGAFGAVLGFIALAAALAYGGSQAANLFSISFEDGALYLILGVLALIAIGKLVSDRTKD